MLNYAGLQKEKDFLRSQATLFDIGFGQKMFMNCSGTGRPTVILDAPTGLTSDAWAAGQRHLAETTRVCVYDRAGLGLSDPPPWLNASDPGEAAVSRTLGPASTAVRMASDLHRLVTFAYPQEKPLILVGSELGGLVARMYSHLHQPDVEHLVLVDPVSETLFDDVTNELDVKDKDNNPWVGYWLGRLLPSCRLLQVAAMAGVTRLALLTGMMGPPHITGGEEDVVVRQKHYLCNPAHLQAVFEEHRCVNQSLAQIREISPAWPLADNMTVTVISGSHYDDQFPPALNRGWSRSVQDLIGSGQLPGARHIVMTGADRHMIHNMAKETLAPVHRLVKKWRRSRAEK